MKGVKVQIPECWFDEKNGASHRKVGIPVFAREAVSRFSDYQLGAALKFPGGYLNKGTAPDGREVVIGFKSAIYRWLNTAPTLVNRCDIIFVTTFEWKDDERGDIELWEFQRDDLVAIIDKIDRERAKRGKAGQHIYVPLDATELEAWEGNLCVLGGSLDAVGKKIFSAPIQWAKGPATSVAFCDGSQPGTPKAAAEGKGADDPRNGLARASSVDIIRLVYRHKEELAEELGLPVSAVNISVSL